jgi:hypothetical protein
VQEPEIKIQRIQKYFAACSSPAARRASTRAPASTRAAGVPRDAQFLDVTEVDEEDPWLHGAGR